MPAYKDEERGTWYTAFYYTTWTGEKKKKKKRGFKKKADAVEFERDFLSKQSMNCDIQFKNLVELYFEDASSRLRLTTIDTKKYMVKKILPYFGELPVNTIKPSHIRKWQNELLSTNYSQTYLKSINNQLSTIFNYAVKYYDLKENPCSKAGSIGKGYADSMKFWTIDEFNTFIEHVSDKPQSRLAFMILFWTGMRCGELLALTLRDIDLDTKTINISKSYARLNKEDIINPPKTSKSKRIITIPKFLVEEINNYVASLYDYDHADRLFAFSKHLLVREMNRGCRKSNIKKIRTHDLRHSHASLLIEMDATPILISERLGHEKVQTTLEIYSHLYPNKHEEVAQKLDVLKNSSILVPPTQP